MRKRLALICCVCLLSGCASSYEDLSPRIMTQLQDLHDQEAALGNNMNKRYYSYYLPQGMGRRDSNELSEVFIKNGYRVIMNFDPSAVVIDTFYTKDSDDENKDKEQAVEEVTLTQEDGIDKYTGIYQRKDGSMYPYVLQVIRNNDQYLLYLDAKITKIYAYVPSGEVMSFLHAMTQIASSIQFDKELVIEDFSMKSLESTKKKNLEYLQQNLPSSGDLSELLNESDINAEGKGDSTEQQGE